MEWEFGVSRCKLLHIEWINNKVLLHSTGNYIQCPEINHNGKEYVKQCVYMYNWITLLYSRNKHNIVNQLYFNKKKKRLKEKKWPHCRLCYRYVCGLKDWNSNPCVCPKEIWQFLSYKFLMAFKNVMLVIVFYGILKAQSGYKQGWYHDQLTSLQHYRVKLKPEANRHLPKESSIAHFFGQPKISIKISMLSVNFETLYILPKINLRLHLLKSVCLWNMKISD